ncbi:MAG: hypothetical protein B6I23_01140 [Rickettsiaceae bacterium 4572_127]|nr:MAG: hypothetical protein B6I23_01140 [Rickettsiaceae bacterium 4572_127]
MISILPILLIPIIVIFFAIYFSRNFFDKKRFYFLFFNLSSFLLAVYQINFIGNWSKFWYLPSCSLASTINYKIFILALVISLFFIFRQIFISKFSNKVKTMSIIAYVLINAGYFFYAVMLVVGDCPT